MITDMKIKLISLFLVLFGALFAEDLKKPLSYKKKPGPIKWSLMPYAEVVNGAFPGAGVTLRARSKQVGIQVDANTALIYVPILFNEVSVASLIYPFSENGNYRFLSGLNMGLGMGLCSVLDAGGTPAAHFPVFIGYQGEHLFIDVSVTARTGNYTELGMMPTFKFGSCF